LPRRVSNCPRCTDSKGVSVARRNRRSPLSGSIKRRGGDSLNACLLPFSPCRKV
jgi:hypothetical protein